MDLYCGTGTIAIWLSEKAAGVVGMEINPGCVADAEANCRKNRVDNAYFIAGDVREAFPGWTGRPMS